VAIVCAIAATAVVALAVMSAACRPTSIASGHGPVVGAASAAPIAVSPSPQATAASTVAPDHLQLPAIGLTAHVESVGTTPQHTMDVPADVRDVGWYAPGVRPGQPGDAVIDGHLDWYTGPAVFSNLSRVNVGDAVVVVYADGGVVTFKVTSSVSYPVNQPPPDLFSPQGPPRLSLITCSGSWNGQQYDQRLVVSAELVSDVRAAA